MTLTQAQRDRVTPAMQAAAWAILRRHKPAGPIFGPGPALAEVIAAALAAEEAANPLVQVDKGETESHA